MMEANSLSPGIWNAIAEMVSRNAAPGEISFHNVRKRDTAKKIIWVEEFGETGIPLITFDFNFAYYDTKQDGTTQKRYDVTADESDPTYRVKILVPRVGEKVAILNPSGNRRFPVCVGVVQSQAGSYWQGE